MKNEEKIIDFLRDNQSVYIDSIVEIQRELWRLIAKKHGASKFDRGFFNELVKFLMKAYFEVLKGDK